MVSTLRVYASNLYDVINIKTVRNVFTGKVLDSNPQEMIVQIGEQKYVFVYRFGCCVFINLDSAEIDLETKKLTDSLGPHLDFITTETYQINVGDFPTRIEFEYVEIKKLTLDHLRMIAVSVGQSAALEYFEMKSDSMLIETSSFMSRMAIRGTVPLISKNLFKIIGSTASVRQKIISSLAILDPPDETWKSKELEKLFKELQQNFDIDTRFKVLDRKLSLVQDNIEILADLVSNRKSQFLEFLIVLLIILEVVLAMYHRI